MVAIAMGDAVSVEDLRDDAWSNVLTAKYEQFDATGSPVIYDILEEELGLIEPQAPVKTKDAPIDPLQLVNLERGKTGVYDLQDLVDVLHLEKAQDLVVMEIPASAGFVDHMVIVATTSQRHLNAVAMTVRRVYNKKAAKRDRALILEGRDSPWVAMDLGNIALHIMSPSERKRVDMESLWLCGSKHDIKLHEDAEKEVDDLFTLADPIEKDFIEEKPYDITKEYDHPYYVVADDDILPDFDEIDDTNRQQYCATSILEMALRKHNKDHSKKYRGRFRK